MSLSLAKTGRWERGRQRQRQRQRKREGENLRGRGHASTRSPVELEDLAGAWDQHAVESVDGFGRGGRAGQFDKAVTSVGTMNSQRGNVNIVSQFCQSLNKKERKTNGLTMG